MSTIKNSIAFVVSDQNESVVRDFIVENMDHLKHFKIILNATQENIINEVTFDRPYTFLPSISDGGIEELCVRIKKSDDINPVIAVGYPSMSEVFTPELLSVLVCTCSVIDIEILFNISGASLIVESLGEEKMRSKKKKQQTISKAEVMSFIMDPVPFLEKPQEHQIEKLENMSKWSLNQIDVWTESSMLEFLKPLLKPRQYLEIGTPEDEIPPMDDFETEHTRYFKYQPDSVYPDYPLVINTISEMDSYYYLTIGMRSSLRAYWDYNSFLKTFLVNYPVFTDSVSLMRQLINEYHRDLPPNTDPADKGDFMEYSPKMPVINVLNTWLKLELGSHFRANIELQEIFEEFITDSVSSEYPASAEMLLRDYNVALALETPYPFPTIGKKPKILTGSKKSVFFNSSIFTINPLEVARQMTLIDETLFHRIRGEEFLRSAWMKKDAVVRAPNLTNFINQSNKFTSALKSESVKIKFRHEVVEFISFWIKVGKEFLELKNYSGLMGVVTTLHSATLSRFKGAWEEVTAKDKRDFEHLTESVGLLGNFQNYRDLLNDIEEGTPIIPLIAVTCSDINGISEVFNPVENEMLNFENMRRWATPIWKFLSLMRARYSLNEDKDIQNQIFEILDSDLIEGESTLSALAKLRDQFPYGPELDGDKALVKKNSRKSVKRSVKTKTGRGLKKSLTLSMDGNEVSHELTELDWSIITDGLAPEMYKKNDIILDDGVVNQHLFRIMSGTVRVDKETGDGVKTVATMGEGSFFGEISMLLSSEQAATTASIVCDEEVSCFKIKAERVINVCINEPVISHKFNRLLCMKLADRFKNTSPAPKTEEDENVEDNTNTEFLKLFKLREGTLLDVTTATYKSGKSSRAKVGKLYLSTSAICFSSSEFGSKMKLKILLGDVREISEVEKGGIDIICEEKTYSFKKIVDDEKFIPHIKNTYETHSGNLVMDDSTMDEEGEQDIMLPTEQDWNLIISGTKTITYEKDNYLIRQGEIKKPRLYQIMSGSCRIEKVLDTGELLTLASLTSEDPIFGEISFLDGTGGKGTASVRSDEDGTVIRILEGSYLDILFEYYPDIAGRYFHYLAVIISSRLKKRHDATRQRAPKTKEKKPKKAKKTKTRGLSLSKSKKKKHQINRE